MKVRVQLERMVNRPRAGMARRAAKPSMGRMSAALKPRQIGAKTDDCNGVNEMVGEG